MSKGTSNFRRRRAFVGVALAAALFAVIAALAYGSHPKGIHVAESEAGAGDTVNFTLGTSQGDSWQIFINDDRLVASGTDSGADGESSSFPMPNLDGASRNVTVDAVVDPSDSSGTWGDFQVIRYRAASSGTTGSGNPAQDAVPPVATTPSSEARAPKATKPSKPLANAGNPAKPKKPAKKQAGSKQSPSTPSDKATGTPNEGAPNDTGSATPESTTNLSSPQPGGFKPVKPTKAAKPSGSGAVPSTPPPTEGKPSGPLGNNPLAPVSGIADLTRGAGAPWGALLVILLASALIAAAIAGWRWRHKLPFFQPPPDEIRVAALSRVALSGADLQHKIAERRIANAVPRRPAVPVGNIVIGGIHAPGSNGGNGGAANEAATSGEANGAATNGGNGTNGAANGHGADGAEHPEPALPGERTGRP